MQLCTKCFGKVEKVRVRMRPDTTCEQCKEKKRQAYNKLLWAKRKSNRPLGLIV